MRNVSLGAGKVPYIVVRMAIDKRFVIIIIMFITVFVRRSNRGPAYYALFKYFR